MKIFNTLNGRMEEFVSLKEGEVGLYTCGPTVYDYAHIGNFRAYVFEDFVRRTFEYLGYRVIQVMNLTDVDDKTIRRSQQEGVTLREYTDRYIQAFFEDIALLGIEPAEHYPRATDHIPEMVAIIEDLLAKGIAYRKGDGIYFDLAKFPKYGALAKLDKAQLKSGARVDVDEYDKENVQDFALWKEAKEGEPFWETSLGKGRPGWHIECSAMSMKYMGPTFDLHMGGVDNIFPHHENEIAQSEAHTGKPFVRYWLHVHHLIVDGTKMSKSLGNFHTLRGLIEKGFRPEVIRFLLLSTHYRKTLNFSFDALAQMEKSWQRIVNFQTELEGTLFVEKETPGLEDWLQESRSKFRAALEDDLNISQALNTLFEFIKEGNLRLSRGEIGASAAILISETLKGFDSVFNLLPRGGQGELTEEQKGLVEERNRFRREKNFPEADRVRKLLLDQGILIEDTRNGVRWKRA